ncbi:hypothetical protein MRX96_026158 [Rhipicephalus microplus]
MSDGRQRHSHYRTRRLEVGVISGREEEEWKGDEEVAGLPRRRSRGPVAVEVLATPVDTVEASAFPEQPKERATEAVEVKPGGATQPRRVYTRSPVPPAS